MNLSEMSPTRAATLGIVAFAVIGVIGVSGADVDTPLESGDASAVAAPKRPPPDIRPLAENTAQASADFDSWFESSDESAVEDAPADDEGSGWASTASGSGGDSPASSGSAAERRRNRPPPAPGSDEAGDLMQGIR